MQRIFDLFGRYKIDLYQKYNILILFDKVIFFFRTQKQGNRPGRAGPVNGDTPHLDSFPDRGLYLRERSNADDARFSEMISDISQLGQSLDVCVVGRVTWSG